MFTKWEFIHSANHSRVQQTLPWLIKIETVSSCCNVASLHTCLLELAAAPHPNITLVASQSTQSIGNIILHACHGMADTVNMMYNTAFTSCYYILISCYDILISCMTY